MSGASFVGSRCFMDIEALPNPRHMHTRSRAGGLAGAMHPVPPLPRRYLLHRGHPARSCGTGDRVAMRPPPRDAPRRASSRSARFALRPGGMLLPRCRYRTVASVRSGVVRGDGGRSYVGVSGRGAGAQRSVVRPGDVRHRRCRPVLCDALDRRANRLRPHPAVVHGRPGCGADDPGRGRDVDGQLWRLWC